MRRILLTFAVAAGVLCGLQRAQATMLTPGGSVTGIDTTAPSGSSLAVVAATGSMSYTLTNPVNGKTEGTGTLQEYVLKGDSGNSFGGLDFVFQLTVKTGSLSTVSLSDFSGAVNNKINLAQTAGPVTLGTGGTILTTGTVQSTGADWSSDGTTVDFDFTNAKAGTTTYVLVVRTGNAQYTSGTIVLEGNSGAGGKFGFAPSPEPASMVLLGCCFAGLGGAGLWRRLRRRTRVA